MFGKKNNTATSAVGGTTLISKSTEIVGDIHFSGTLLIEGHVKGNVYALDGEEAQARILASGKVEGEIRVPTLVINGEVTGDVFSSKHIELATNTVITGNVHYVLIEVLSGAQVNGELVHAEVTTLKKGVKVDHSVEINPSKIQSRIPAIAMSKA